MATYETTCKRCDWTSGKQPVSRHRLVNWLGLWWQSRKYDWHFLPHAWEARNQ